MQQWNKYDEDLFMKYVQLPKRSRSALHRLGFVCVCVCVCVSEFFHFAMPHTLHTPRSFLDGKQFVADLYYSVDIPFVAQIQDDTELVEDYLDHFFRLVRQSCQNKTVI